MLLCLLLPPVPGREQRLFLPDNVSIVLAFSLVDAGRPVTAGVSVAKVTFYLSVWPFPANFFILFILVLLAVFIKRGFPRILFSRATIGC